jgi:hypothetical protein
MFTTSSLHNPVLHYGSIRETENLIQKSEGRRKERKWGWDFEGRMKNWESFLYTGERSY